VDKYAKGTGTLTQYETMHVLKSDSSRANKDEIVVCFTPQSLAIETERIILSTLPASNTPMSAAVPYTGFKQSGFNVTQTAMTDPDSCPSSVVNVAGGAGGSCIVCLPQ
jgi:hypothetical protein